MRELDAIVFWAVDKWRWWRSAGSLTSTNVYRETDSLKAPFEPQVQPSTSASEWSIAKAARTYGVDDWSNGFFSISPHGDVEVRLGYNGDNVRVGLPEIVQGARDRGLNAPLLLRFPDLLAHRLQTLNEAFEQAIATLDYQGNYRGVYPIKVNQQEGVVREITRLGRRHHVGLEVGTKPELLAALAFLQDPDAWLVCNGYKDHAFIDLALCAMKMGLQIVLIIEMPCELDLILGRAEALEVEPVLGVRVKLNTENGGRWARSSGDASVFGLTSHQVVEVLDKLREAGKLECLQLLHYHQGSQVPDIRAIRNAAMEATRMYVALTREGAAMRVMDIGGGLAVDYDGSKSNSANSRNYGILEYATDIVEIIKTVCDEADQPHPDIISESGRFIAAHCSVLVFNILDVNRGAMDELADTKPEKCHAFLDCLRETHSTLTPDNMQECYNDAVYYRSELLSLFKHGLMSLRERAYADQLFGRIVGRISAWLAELDKVPDELAEFDRKSHDVYYGNFSLFQSLPDSWAIDQVFPVMPIHRLTERPDCKAIVADITCDCDGRMDHFLYMGRRQRHLMLHNLPDDEDYWLGVFLIGAYQETLGDLHNLFGDPNLVSVSLSDGRLRYDSEVRGDSVAEVLGYVEYHPKDLVERFRALAEAAVHEEKITAQERRAILSVYEDNINGYTYYERHAPILDEPQMRVYQHTSRTRERV